MDIKQAVRDKYGAAARQARSAKASCCKTTSCGDPISSDLYRNGETDGLPEAALLASLGCGNPTALAELKPGEVVLDPWIWRRHRRVVVGAPGRS
jgi:hypothetical protein